MEARTPSKPALVFRAGPIAGLLAAVLLTGCGLVLYERAAAQDRPSPAAAGPGQPAAPPGEPLPPQDLEGRIAPAAGGSRMLPDAGPGLGSLTIEQVVRAGPVPDGEVSPAVQGLRTLGMQDGFGRNFAADRYTLTVSVYRFSTPEGAASLVELATDATARDSESGVPGAVVLPPAPGSTAFGGLFSYRSHAYELTLSGTSGAFDSADVDAALRHQYDHVLLTG